MADSFWHCACFILDLLSAFIPSSLLPINKHGYNRALTLQREHPDDSDLRRFAFALSGYQPWHPSSPRQLWFVRATSNSFFDIIHGTDLSFPLSCRSSTSRERIFHFFLFHPSKSFVLENKNINLCFLFSRIKDS